MPNGMECKERNTIHTNIYIFHAINLGNGWTQSMINYTVFILLSSANNIYDHKEMKVHTTR